MRYYRGNFWRFANLMRRGELNQIIRPGKFYNRPVNNVEQILHFKDIHFEKLINKTLDEYVINVIFISALSLEDINRTFEGFLYPHFQV